MRYLLFQPWACVRLSRESVWTAFTPPSFLSTYIVCSSGWAGEEKAECTKLYEYAGYIRATLRGILGR